MAELNFIKVPNIKAEPNNSNPIIRNLSLIFLLVLVLSLVVYFSTDIHWLEITFAHLGAFGIVGLLGCCTGLIAVKKGYNFRNAFLIGMLFPIIFGFVAVLLFQPGSCGGSVSLAVALTILVIYSLLKSRIIGDLI